ILKKNPQELGQIDPALLVEEAEKALAEQVAALEPQVCEHMQAAQLAPALAALAALKQAVDRFFDEVMVMAEDERVRNNRLALLSKLHGMMNQVADISRLTS